MGRTGRRLSSPPEYGHRAVIGFTDTVGFLTNVQALEVVVPQQMIAAVFKPVDSIQFKIAEWARPGFI